MTPKQQKLANQIKTGEALINIGQGCTSIGCAISFLMVGIVITYAPRFARLKLLTVAILEAKISVKQVYEAK